LSFRSDGSYLYDLAQGETRFSRTVVREEFLDQINMRHQHPSAAVSFATELIHRVADHKCFQPSIQAIRHGKCSPVANASIQKRHVAFPKVRDDLRRLSISTSRRLAKQHLPFRKKNTSQG
jgi:hypothetical protein